MPPPPSSSSSRPPQSSNGPPPAPSTGASTSSRGPGGAAQGGKASAAPAGRARAVSNVGARLLKKRQSVAYAAHPGISVDYASAPAVPSLPSVPQGGPAGRMPPGGPGGGGGAPDSQHVPGGPGLGPVVGSSGQLQRAPSGPQQQQQQQQAPPRSPRPEAENQLLATGLDVDQLAHEGFKPEDCAYIFPSSLSPSPCGPLLTPCRARSPQAEPPERARRQPGADGGPAAPQGSARERDEDHRGRAAEERLQVRARLPPPPAAQARPGPDPLLSPLRAQQLRRLCPNLEGDRDARERDARAQGRPRGVAQRARVARGRVGRRRPSHGRQVFALFGSPALSKARY